MEPTTVVSEVTRGLPVKHKMPPPSPPSLVEQQEGYDVRGANIYNKAGVLRQGERDMLTCPICNPKILRDPVQLISCGCRFCQSCLQNNVISSSTSGPMKCPVDGEEFTLAKVRKDKGCQKELNSLEVDCPMEPEPCGWRGALADLQGHVQKVCPNVIVQCESKCGESFPRSQKQAHDTHCLKREEPCEHCGIPVVRDELQDHLSSCPECPMDCDFCHESIPTRKQWQKHLDHDCTEYEMYCPFREESECTIKAKKLEMAEHVKENHLIASIEQVGSLKKDVSSLKSENELLKEQMKRRDDVITQFEKQLKSGNDRLLTEMKRRDDIITQLEKRLREVESVFKGQRYHSDFVESDSGATGRKPTRQQAFTDGGMFDGSSSATVGKLREEMDTSKSQISQLNDSMQTIQSAFTQFGVMVDEVRLRQDVLDVKTTTGVFVWKIPDIRRRYGDAIERRTLSLYSPPFYTSPHGYRMCIRTYLNGDGVGKGSHISLFFVLMKSEHDSLLSWPFKQAVRFTLINQRNRANDITEAFAPDLSSPSFQRPQGDMNVASGFPRFAKQSVLQDDGFTKDNVIFIKAQVDLNGLNLD